MVKLRNPFLMMGEMSKSPHRGAGVEKGEKFFFNAAGEINARICVRARARPRELGIKICDTELSAMATFAGLKVSDQPAGILIKHCSSTMRYSVSLSQNQPVLAKFQTSQRSPCVLTSRYRPRERHL